MHCSNESHVTEDRNALSSSFRRSLKTNLLHVLVPALLFPDLRGLRESAGERIAVDAAGNAG
jgi:hypothetical protein